MMKEGAFALFDCLGFKGVWRRTDPVAVVQKLRSVQQAVKHEVGRDYGLRLTSYGPISIQTHLLSDTVAISAHYRTQSSEAPNDLQKAYLVSYLAISVVQVLQTYVSEPPSLVMRGCISYGEHLSEGNFILGPAVDEAAEHMNVAQGAFVWLLPSSAELHHHFIGSMDALLARVTPEVLMEGLTDQRSPASRHPQVRRLLKHHPPNILMGEVLLDACRTLAVTPVVLDSYALPLKDGSSLNCPVVNPLAFLRDASSRESVIQAYDKCMTGNSLDVWLKRQNTLEFLKHANVACTLFESALSDHFPGSSKS
jgi:hypothetical protein